MEKIRDKLTELSQQQKQKYNFDASAYNDPIAEKTDWTPLKAGGANFQTHKLNNRSSTILEYTLSKGGKIFLSLFAMIGILVILVGLSPLINGTVESIFAFIFGSVFTGVSYLMYWHMGKPVTFDMKMGLIWIGQKPKKFAGDIKTKNIVYINNIHALQILSERVRGNKTTYYSYEINLVLNDGSRFNLVDHGNHAEILLDAQTLSTFLNKPLWNAS
ncbi:MAG: hypothetical protein AB8B80_00620 [Marinicellaceae bacterium]